MTFDYGRVLDNSFSQSDQLFRYSVVINDASDANQKTLNIVCRLLW